MRVFLTKFRDLAIDLRRERAAKSIAYSDGIDVRFVNVGSFDQAPDRVCRGGWGTGGSGGGGIGDDGEAMVTSLAFDAASSAVIYVGYETGAVMVRVPSLECAEPRR